MNNDIIYLIENYLRIDYINELEESVYEINSGIYIVTIGGYSRVNWRCMYEYFQNCNSIYNFSNLEVGVVLPKCYVFSSGKNNRSGYINKN